MRKNLTRKERLGSKAEFTRVFNLANKRSGCQGAKLVARCNNQEFSRFGVALVRKYGNAVKRNYGRRVLREIYRNVKHKIMGGYDIIIVLYPGDYRYNERERQLMNLMRRAELVQTDG